MDVDPYAIGIDSSGDEALKLNDFVGASAGCVSPQFPVLESDFYLRPPHLAPGRDNY